MRQSYGSNANQFGDLTLPAEVGAGPVPVVVLIHGGFWRTGYGLDLMEPLVPSLVESGYAVWNIEYRRVGGGEQGGGGYPATFDDAADAIDLLTELPAEVRNRLDLDRVATVGHSAGGHLAVWLASRSSLPEGSSWSGPAVEPVLAVSQAGVLDLERCVADGVGGSACSDLLGVGADGATSAEFVDRLRVASPAAMLPVDARVVAVHGSADRIVPLNQSESYVATAREVGVAAEVMVIENADHFSVIDPAHPAWLAVLDALSNEFSSS